ncbi:MAG: aminoglycoside phosphotransferase [Betaproteobacteria bacterium]|nr:aminoglycoside phosphotransferase [Betaproteobacteria bacterium]
MNRQQLLETWLHERLGQASLRIEPASADASFRRYFRVFVNGQTLIAMDAPPPQEDCRPFVHVAKLFHDAGVHVPRIVEQDLAAGFLLLSDLGAQTYLQRLSPENAGGLYSDAIDALISIQLASRAGQLPAYDHALLHREVMLFPDWYIQRHLNTALTPGQRSRLEAVFNTVLARNLNEGKVYVHRDYHSRNLMIGAPNPGILDFQDAVHGPISYDLVSLLKDAYIAWDEERVLDWTARYWQQARKASLPVPADFGEFYKDFEWMGVQRHLKVLGIFARLWHRDGKDGYLKDLPLVMAYLRKACARYAELNPMIRLLDELQGKSITAGLTF